MSRRDVFYTRVLRVLRTLLPLLAIVLLSTMFLASRRIEPSGTVLRDQIDLTAALETGQLTGPAFTAVTQDGDSVVISARTARPEDGDPKHIRVEALALEISHAAPVGEGRVRTQMHAPEAVLSLGEQEIALNGPVTLSTSSGYRIDLDGMDLSLRHTHGDSRGAVTATGPAGRISAGGLQLISDRTGGHTEVLFSGGVKLLYTPQIVED